MLRSGALERTAARRLLEEMVNIRMPSTTLQIAETKAAFWGRKKEPIVSFEPQNKCIQKWTD